MTNEVTTTTKKPVLELDGFNDFTDEVEGDDNVNTGGSIIQGKKLKFLDPDWHIEAQIVTGMRLTAINVLNVVTKWGHNNKPLETKLSRRVKGFPTLRSSMPNAPRANGVSASVKWQAPGADNTVCI